MARPDKKGTNVPSNTQELRSSLSSAQCKTCGQIKPKKEFLKRLTLAQTRAFLKQPSATTRFIATSKNCKTCQAKLKRHSKRPLTAKQIRTKITSGDMHPIQGELKLQQLKESLPKTRSRVMKETWQKRRAQPYKQLKRHLQDQLNRFGNRHFASKNLQEATQLQNAHNYIEAKRIMRDLLEQAEKGTNVPLDIQIASLIKPKGATS
jgi:hypothetical protein